MSIEPIHQPASQQPFAAHPGLYDTALRDHHVELRRKFADAGDAALNDAEMLELLLLSSTPRADTRPIADDLIKRFGSFQQVLCADTADLDAVAGSAAAGDLTLIAATARRMALKRLEKAPLISSWDAVITYCRTALAHETREQFRVLFLNRANRLIADECLGYGTVDHVPVYPREVIKRALDLNACAIILVHNHPSGDPTPSDSDVAMTRQIQQTAEALSITLHDHLIVGADREISMISAGLI